MNIAELIIYEDEDIVVCHKPAGVLSQADRGFSEDMVSALMAYEKKKTKEMPFIAPVNRLDRPVEGLILFAKKSSAAKVLTGQITSGNVDKCYYAVVETLTCDGSHRTGMGQEICTQQKNIFPEKTFLEEKLSEGKTTEGRSYLLTDYLVKDSKTNTSHVGSRNDKDAKKAELEYTVLKKHEGRALLDIKLHTGRHHQIRVQLSHAGMPLMGDTKYNPKLAGAKGWHNIALCSYRLEFAHPSDGRRMSFEVKPHSPEFKKFFQE